MALARLRILVFPESPRSWTARALEHDLAGAGVTMEAALDTVLKVARAHINYDLRHGRQPLSAFAAAPRLYWEAFSGATRVDIRLDLAGEETAIPMRVIAATLPQHPIVKLYCERVRSA
jgi:hypothetical protein